MRIDREFVRELFDIEFKSPEGRMNWRLCVLMFVLVACLTVFSSTFETVARFFESNYTSGTPYVQLVLVFLLGMLFCVAILGVLSDAIRRRR